MESTRDGKLKVVRAISALSAVYWETHAFERPSLVECRESWLLALESFVCNYALRHRGIPCILSDIAAEALGQAAGGLAEPDETFAMRAWEGYSKVMMGYVLSRGNDPLRCSPDDVRNGTNGHLPATLFATRLSDHGYNILEWTRSMLAEGRVDEAARRISSINGVTSKVCSYYLRDVANRFELDECRPGHDWHFQPVDGCVMGIARVWGRDAGVEIQTTEQASRLFASLARQAHVRGSDLNAGAWVLHSQLAGGRESVVERVVESPENLEALMGVHLVWCRTMCETLTPLVGAGAGGCPADVPRRVVEGGHARAPRTPWMCLDPYRTQ
jgi:hypothetical protein